MLADAFTPVELEVWQNKSANNTDEVIHTIFLAFAYWKPSDAVLYIEKCILKFFDNLYYCLSMIYKNNGTNKFCQSMMQNLHFEGRSGKKKMSDKKSEDLTEN